MRINGEYLRNLPVLLDQWVKDIERLDIRSESETSRDVSPQRREYDDGHYYRYRESAEVSHTQRS